MYLKEEINMNKNNKRKGFTLIELVIVVAIIGILSLMIIPQFQRVTEDAKEKAWRSDCTTVSSAIGMYQAANNGDFPANEEDLGDYIAGGCPEGDGTRTTFTYTSLPDGDFESTFTRQDNDVVINYSMTGGFEVAE